MPGDYPDPVATDWPDLLEIVENKVKPERLSSRNTAVAAHPWWQHWRFGGALAVGIAGLSDALVLSRVSTKLAVGRSSTKVLFADSTVIFAFQTFDAFGLVQSRPHEIWANYFSSSMKDDLRYSVSDCFSTFPFPNGFGSENDLETTGKTYYDFRAQFMIEANKGLTHTYNRFHDSYDSDPTIQRLRDFHADMDRAVLRAYGWDDLAEAANPVFLTEETETEFTYQGRLFWPSDFRDEVLARLLDLNRTRHAAEANAGIAIATAPDAPHSAATDRIRARQIDFGLDAGPLFDRTGE